MEQKNTTYITLAFVIILLLAGGAWYYSNNVAKQKAAQQTTDQQNEVAQVNKTVTDLGVRLKNVSLMAPKADVLQAIDTYYKDYVTPELLTSWKADPTKAPGRLTSSPWPDRIEISSTEKVGNQYTVKGDIVEITSTEAGTSNAVNKTPVTLGLEKRQEGWRINSYVTEQNQQQSQNATKDDLIFVEAPLINQVVVNPLKVTGKARGNWYFEASFPVKLLDANGKVLAQKPAQAQSDWMTTNYVNFTVTLTFTKPTTATGTLVLEKDNPSGLPANANELRIPVKFQ